MSQSTLIAGSLLLAFVIYVTMKGELSAYGALFTKSAAAATAAGGTSGTVTPLAPLAPIAPLN